MYENKIERLENEVKQLREKANTEMEKAVEKTFFSWLPTRSDKNRAVQPEKTA